MAGPVVQAHPRGVFRDEDSFAGTVVFRVYDCRGRLVKHVEVAADMCDDATGDHLLLWLDQRCPEWCTGEHRLNRPSSHRFLRAL